MEPCFCWMISIEIDLTGSGLVCQQLMGKQWLELIERCTAAWIATCHLTLLGPLDVLLLVLSLSINVVWSSDM